VLLCVIICYTRWDIIIIVSLFVSSVKCPLIIVNLNEVMIRNPQQSVGCWIMEKQVTPNVTQLSLAENLVKWLGRQVLASFSLIWSSILVIKELHLRWTGATLVPVLFLGLLKYCLLNFNVKEHLPILWKSLCRFPDTHQWVVCRVSQFSSPCSLTTSDQVSSFQSLSSLPSIGSFHS
jgi:hypothetical protein